MVLFFSPSTPLDLPSTPLQNCWGSPLCWVLSLLLLGSVVGPPSSAYATRRGSPRRQLIRSTSLTVHTKYNTKKQHHTLDVTLRNYRFRFGQWLRIGGTVSGRLKVKTTSSIFTDYRTLLPHLVSLEGALHFTSLAIPFYGTINDIDITFTPTAVGHTQFHGALGTHLRLLGSLGAGRVDGTAVFHGVSLSKRLPFPYSQLFEVTAGGEVKFSLDPSLRSSIALTGLLALLKRRGRRGEHLTLRNDGPVLLEYRHGQLKLVRALFTLRTAQLHLSGVATKRKLHFNYRAAGDIKHLCPWIPGPIYRLKGTYLFTGTVRGPLNHPIVTAALSMTKGRVLHNDGRTLFSIRQLGLDYSPKGFSFRARFEDRRKRPLKIDIHSPLLSYVPQKIRGSIKGALPGEVLSSIDTLPLKDPRGYGRIDATLSGDFFHPTYRGTFWPERISIRPKGLYRELRISRGKIYFHNKNLHIDSLSFAYDNSVIWVSGFVKLQRNFYINLFLRGVNIPFRRVDAFRGELNPSLELKGYRDNMVLSGTLDIITGRYTRKYDIIKKIITIHRYREDQSHPWDHHPWMGRIALDLAILNTGDLKVDNNLGELNLDGALSLKGTVAAPRLKGAVNVNSGTFKIPFLRGVYEVDNGSIDFDKSETPFLRLEGSTTVENIYVEEILVSLHLQGPIDRISFRLSSFPELEQGQILMLLASGRTTKDIRKLYQNDPKSGTGTASAGYNPMDLYDEPIKQITGDFFSQLVEQPIKMVTKLDLVRFELGSDSFRIKISKKFIQRIKFKGEFEVGFMGKNRQQMGLQVKFHDRLSLDSMVRRYEPGLNEYVYETPLKGKLELKYKLKLKGSLRDMLGIN